MKAIGTDQRIARAKELARSHPEAAELLNLYGKVMAFQLRGGDLPELLHILDTPRELKDSPEVEAFFTRVLEQPVMEQRALSSLAPTDVVQNICPFCGSKPVVAVLRSEGDGGKRSLVCSRCSLEWSYRRILCPSCGEEDREKLPVFTAAEFDCVRIEACDSCHTYIKCVDLTKNGLAVPVIDELASIVLDLWAEDHGYSKLQPNILGF